MFMHGPGDSFIFITFKKYFDGCAFGNVRQHDGIYLYVCIYRGSTDARKDTLLG